MLLDLLIYNPNAPYLFLMQKYSPEHSWSFCIFLDIHEEVVESWFLFLPRHLIGVEANLIVTGREVCQNGLVFGFWIMGLDWMASAF